MADVTFVGEAVSAGSLNSTPSDFVAESYISVVEADAYFGNHPKSTDWDDASSADQVKSLQLATLMIDMHRFHHGKYRVNPEQPLMFPRGNARVAGGTADSGSTTTIVDATLADDPTTAPTNYYKNWAVEVTAGTNLDEIRLVTAYNASTGQLTVETAFTNAIDSTSQFILIEKIPNAVRYACAEIAIWLLGGGDANKDPNIKAKKIGDFSVSYFEGAAGEITLPEKANILLKPYISKIGRFY